MNMNAVYQLRDLEFSYTTTTPLLRNLNLTAYAGCCTSILGPNGCGKSTLLRLLAGRLMPQAGEIILFNQKLANCPLRQLAVTIGYLPQKSLQSTEISVLELLQCARYPHHESRATGKNKIKEALELMEVPEKLWQTQLNHLSGGEMQRVMLAFVLAKNPAILLLDEPTSGLDLRGKQDFINLINKLKQEKNLSIICVLHELEIAAAISEQIWLTSKENGAITGTPEKVLTGENISKIFRVKFDDSFDIRKLKNFQ